MKDDLAILRKSLTSWYVLASRSSLRVAFMCRPYSRFLNGLNMALRYKNPCHAEVKICGILFGQSWVNKRSPEE